MGWWRIDGPRARGSLVSISSGARAFCFPSLLACLLALASCASVVLPLLTCPVLVSLVCPAFWTSVCPSSHFPPAGSFMRERGLLWLPVLPRRGGAEAPGRKRLVYATVDGDIAATRVKRLARERKGWGDQAEVCGCRFAICWLIGWKKGGCARLPHVPAASQSACIQRQSGAKPG